VAITRDQLDEKLRSLINYKEFAKRRELDVLASQLEPGEDLTGIAEGVIDDSKWLVCVTPARMLFSGKSLLSGEKRQEILISEIDDVTCKRGFLLSCITLRIGDKKHKIDYMQKEKAEVLAYIINKARGASASQSALDQSSTSEGTMFPDDVVSEPKSVKTQDFSPANIRGFPRIPFEVAELVWFMDGPSQNYDASDIGHKMELIHGFELHMYMTSDIEPSAISTKLMIKQPRNPLFVESLSYFPRYDLLTPEQRWIYLDWLTDIDKPVNIGYVFLYYYGLERHLFLGLYEQAFRMIVRLRKHHLVSSFPRYSANALLAAILLHKRTDLYDIFAESFLKENMMVSNLHLYVKYLLNFPITPEEIIYMSSVAGFTNKRYIKAEYSLFLDILSRNLYDCYGIMGMPWNDVIIDKIPKTYEEIVANTSLTPRNISIPKLFGDKQLSNNVLKLLQKTHEDTKNQLKILRKGK
jgi:hypothetical protein